MIQSKNSRIVSDQQLMAGLEKHLGKTGVIVIRGEKHKVSDVIETLRERIQAATPVEPARAAWLAAAAKERDVVEETKDLVADVKKYIALVHAASPEALADFGIVPKKRRLTVEEKTEMVDKSKATRAARHTMGRRQKAKVKGVVADAPAPAPQATTNGFHA